VFGRIGARPFTLAEQRRLYMGPDGKPFFVTDKVRLEDYRGPKPSARPPAAADLPTGMRVAPRDAVSTEPVGRTPGTGLR